MATTRKYLIHSKSTSTHITFFFFPCRTEKRAAYIHSDATRYSDITALFQLAEKEFGGVDVKFLFLCYLLILVIKLTLFFFSFWS